MRDDQILQLLERERAHNGNVCMLGDQQSKMGVESLLDVICERGSMIKTFFKPAWFRKRFEKVYGDRAKAFNEKIRSDMAREKLKI